MLYYCYTNSDKNGVIFHSSLSSFASFWFVLNAIEKINLRMKSWIGRIVMQLTDL